jgi:DNA-binding NarL/FixJ family response regulator
MAFPSPISPNANCGVLVLVIEGKSNKFICRTLNLSDSIVKRTS